MNSARTKRGAEALGFMDWWMKGLMMSISIVHWMNGLVDCWIIGTISNSPSANC